MLGQYFIQNNLFSTDTQKMPAELRSTAQLHAAEVPP